MAGWYARNPNGVKGVLPPTLKDILGKVAKDTGEWEFCTDYDSDSDDLQCFSSNDSGKTLNYKYMMLWPIPNYEYLKQIETFTYQ